MVDLILKKSQELKARRPSNPEFWTWLDQSNLWYWLYFDMSLRGIKVTRRQIADVLDGKILEDCPMEVYGFVHGFADIYRNMKSLVNMQTSLTPAILDKWCVQLFDPRDKDGNAVSPRRMSTSVVYEWGHIPPHFHEVSTMLGSLLKACCRERYPGNWVDRVLDMYIGILSIYPYGENSVTVAGMAFVYGLMEEGIPLPALELSEVEFNTLVAEYMEHGNGEPLRSAIERSIYNRLDAVYVAAMAAEDSYEQH